jgi:hypothetical protein
MKVKFKHAVNMDNLKLIYITQYAYALLGKGLPKSCVLMANDNVAQFCYYCPDRKYFCNTGTRPVGFYFEKEHKFELRSKYDGNTLIEFKGGQLDHIIDTIYSVTLY